MPKLSIITVNLNNKNGLVNTAESVVAQTWTDYEWIIIDGGSTDGSVDVIKKYTDKTDKLVYWCSEPDGGIYQGMNKGIENAVGFRYIKYRIYKLLFVHANVAALAR